MKDRNEINLKDKWDLSSLFKNDKQYKESIKSIHTSIDKLKNFKDKISNFSIFKEAISLYYDILEKIERIAYYASLRISEDVSKQNSNELYAIYLNISTYMAMQSSYFIPEMQRIDLNLIKEWISSLELKNYKIAIEKIIRQKEHTLSEQEEAILSQYTPLYDSYENIFSALTNADMKFEEINEMPLTNSTYSLFLEDENPKLREEAYCKYYKEFYKHENTLANLLISKINQSLFIAKTKKYQDALEMALFKNNIDKTVYTNLIEVVNENLPILNSYYELKRNILKQDFLNHWDVYVPLVKDIKFEYSYEEATLIICKALEVFGNEYTSTLRKGLIEDNWVDKYENNGKKSGAFSAGSYYGKPYILLNYKNESIRSMFTLAHEVGHSMHTWFSTKNNSFPQYQYAIFEAEVASTVNEQLLGQYLIENEKNIKKINYIQLKQLDDFVATFFRQTMFAEFEYEIHDLTNKGKPLTKEKFKEIYFNLLNKYFGASVKLNSYSTLECLRIPHFYSPFYVYQYATGITAALAIFKNILDKKENALKNYIDFLKIGGSKYSLVSLKAAGIDLTNKSIIQNTIDIFKERLDKIKSIFYK